MSGRKRPRRLELSALAARQHWVGAGGYSTDSSGKFGRRHIDKYASKRPMKCPRCDFVGLTAEFIEHQKRTGHAGLPGRATP